MKTEHGTVGVATQLSDIASWKGLKKMQPNSRKASVATWSSSLRKSTSFMVRHDHLVSRHKQGGRKCDKVLCRNMAT